MPSDTGTTGNISTQIAVLSTQLDEMEKRLILHVDRLNEANRQTAANADRKFEALDQRLDDHGDRITNLEASRYKATGVFAAIGLIWTTAVALVASWISRS